MAPARRLGEAVVDVVEEAQLPSVQWHVEDMVLKPSTEALLKGALSISRRHLLQVGHDHVCIDINVIGGSVVLVPVAEAPSIPSDLVQKR